MVWPFNNLMRLRDIFSSAKDEEIARLRKQVTELESLLENYQMFAGGLQRQISIDLQTGLSSRIYLNEVLSEIYKRAMAPLEERCPSDSYQLFFIDIDGLKNINDTYSHTGGDAAIQAVADFLKRNFGLNDLVARMYGDEFVVIMMNADEEAAQRKRQQLLEGFKTLNFVHEGQAVPVSASVGTCPIDGTRTTSQIIDTADQDMMRYKTDCRKRCDLSF